MAAARIVLLDGATANSTSEAMRLPFRENGHWLIVSGNLGGGTIQLEVEAIDGSFVPIIGGVLDSLGAKFMEGTPVGKNIRAVLAGSTGANVNLEVTT